MSPCPTTLTKELWVFLMLFCWTACLAVAQPIVEGRSVARSGMLFYDFRESSDPSDKIFRYTLCPVEAGCISLDFNELDTCASEGFVRVFRQEGKEWKLLTTWGGGKGGHFLECDAECLAFEFHCTGNAKLSRWNALWMGTPKDFCIDPSEPRTNGIQDVCASVYVGRLDFQHSFSKLTLADGWQPKLKQCGLFRFKAADSGELDFLLKPQNHLDNLNWVLWKVPYDSTGRLPKLDSLPEPLSWNYAHGRQRDALTGMHPTGNGGKAQVPDSPISRPIVAKKGDQYLLLVENEDGHSKHVEIRLGNVVMACDNPVDSVTRFVSQSIAPPSRCGGIVASREILRLDLQTKMNRPLSMLKWNPGIFSNSLSKSHSNQDFKAGLVELLLFGIQSGVFPAYTPDRSRMQLHYGDLLVMAEGNGDAPGSLPTWRAVDDPPMGPFTHYVEFVVEQCTDRNTSSEHRRIKQIRLLWADGASDTPDYCVGLMNYEDLTPYFRLVRFSLPGNEASETNLDDYLNKHLYEAVPVQVGGKPARSLGGTHADQQARLQLQDFLWTR